MYLLRRWRRVVPRLWVLGLLFATTPQRVACHETNGPAKSLEQKSERNLVSGQLLNGIRYILERDTTQPGRVDVRLVIRAGTADEGEEERGVAHLIEHLGFDDGSSDMPGKAVVDFARKRGLLYGQGLSGTTGPFSTVYGLSFSASSRITTSDSMRILNGWARRLRLSDAGIDLERDVVLAEAIGGENVFGTEWEIAREILGTDARADRQKERERVSTMEHERVRAFYKRYYQPSRIVIIVAGDIDINRWKRSISSTFGGWKKEGSDSKFPKLAKPVLGRKPIYRQIPSGGGKPSIRFYSIIGGGNDEAQKDVERRRLLRSLVNELLAHRAAIVSRRSERAFTIETVPGVLFDPKVEKDGIYATAEVPEDNYAATAQLILETMEQLKRDGFAAGEISRAKSLVAADISNSMETPTVRANAYSELVSWQPWDISLKGSGEKLVMLEAIGDEEINEYVAKRINDYEDRYLLALADGPLSDSQSMRLTELIARRRAISAAKFSSPHYISDFVLPAELAIPMRPRQIGTSAWTSKLSNGVNLLILPIQPIEHATPLQISFYSQNNADETPLLPSDIASISGRTDVSIDQLREEAFSMFQDDAGLSSSFLAGQAYDHFSISAQRSSLKDSLQFARIAMGSNGIGQLRWGQGWRATFTAPFIENHEKDVTISPDDRPTIAAAVQTRLANFRPQLIIIAGKFDPLEAAVEVERYLGESVAGTRAVSTIDFVTSASQVPKRQAGSDVKLERTFSRGMAVDGRSRVTLALLQQIASLAFQSAMRNVAGGSYFHGVPLDINDAGLSSANVSVEMRFWFISTTSNAPKLVQNMDALIERLAAGTIELDEFEQARTALRTKYAARRQQSRSVVDIAFRKYFDGGEAAVAQSEQDILDDLRLIDVQRAAREMFHESVYAESRSPA